MNQCSTACKEAGSSQRTWGKKDAMVELTQMPESFKAAAEDVLPPEFLEVPEISGTTENLSCKVEDGKQHSIFRTKE